MASANDACSSLLPAKSRELYEKTYNEFKTWCTEQQITNYTEPVFLAYFLNIAQRGLIASLWPKFSMLKSTLYVKKNIDIGKFNKLIMYVKRQTEGHVPKKSKVLEKEQVQKCILDAPNNLFLMTKAVTIFGVCGGCRRQELCDVKVQHVKDEGAVIVVRIPDTKSHVSRAFTILSDGNGFNPIDLVRQYMKLRPSHTKIDRFFLSYRNKKCTVQPVGIKTIGKFPSIIAKYLGLENAASYTGHCYRRTSATLLANAGADVLTLKRHGSWKSSTVAENYVAESMCNKIKIAKMIQCGDGIETN
ncbi:unnamed protein product, partial [Tenebrio molitor]